MKILAIDDQQLILLSVKRRLTALGYQVVTATSIQSGIQLYNQFDPDLVLLDMNMPEMAGNQLVDCTGMEVVKYIRLFLKRTTPIVVLSGNTNEEVILENFNLGIDDYLKKPLSLDEMTARIKRIIGVPRKSVAIEKVSPARIIQKKCIGVVLYCFNEEERLLGDDLKNFAERNLGYHLCFVNDGSTDNTLQVLYELRLGNETNITILNCTGRVGKAESIRLGMLHLAKDSQLDYIGYLDVGTSDDIQDFDDLVETMDKSEFKFISGSKNSTTSVSSPKLALKKFVNKSFGLIFKSVVRLPLLGTKSGASIVERELIKPIFEKCFITEHLLNVEIFVRLRKLYGTKNSKAMSYEHPIKTSSSPNEPQLSLRTSGKILGQLAKIAMVYR